MLTRLVAVIIFENFSFALFTPPLGDYQWGMPKLEGEKKKNELVRLPYHFKFKKHFKEPCQ
jgi:hypothetical protein